MMALNPATASMTEQQFEAQIRAAILRAFPWLPAEQITHQTTFRFKFGHATIVVDGVAKAEARARADVLVLFRGKPLAVFELKRPGLGVSRDDEEQGLSYARMLHPRPPLVVISDGKAVRLLETHSGAQWAPTEHSEADVAALLRNATEVARADLKRAIEILMGTDASIWMQAVRQATAIALDERSGGWDDPLAPLVRGFLLPRKVTSWTKQLLEQRQRLVLIEGGPLSGKSNALRELAQLTAAHPDLAVLYIDADPGVDLFEQLSLILSGALNWPITRDEARQWLVSLSRANGPALVIAVDNMGPDRDDLRRDLEALTSNLFGMNIRVVVAVDDSVAAQLARLRNGRTPSSLMKRAARLALGPLDGEEFRVAETHLARHRMSLITGARYSPELRAPWVLRAMAAEAATSDEYQNPSLVAAMSPVPGLDLISHVRDHFDTSETPFARYRELAKAVLEDGQDRTRPFELVLELLETFVVRRATAQKHLDGTELRAMLSSGLIREARSASGENIFVVRLPELMASEIAALLAEALPDLSRDDPAVAAGWLAGAASNLPLGDLIAAQALIDAAIRNRGLSLQLIAELRRRAPTRETLAPGTQTIGWMHGVGVFSATLQDNGTVLIERGGEAEVVAADEGESSEHVAYTDVHPFLILSHLAGHRFELVAPDLAPRPRIDPDLLLGVGACPVLLRRPGGDPDVASVPVHEIGEELSLVCHEAGIVEPITWSMVRFFGREDETMRNQLIDEALTRCEPALLARLDVALRQISQSADKPRATWAVKVRHDRLGPLLETGLGVFVHD